MLRRSLLPVIVVFVLGACRPLDLPAPPGTKPGSLQGSVRYTQPGRSAELGAQGASVQLLNSSASATAQENGFFSLVPITTTTGDVLISFQVPDAGTTLKKVLRLQDYNAGPNRDVAIGSVVLGGNAALRGKVELSDQPGLTRGLGGTTVFVPEGPFLTYTGDDGTFLMDDLPEGRLTLAFFRPGYGASSAQVTLVANQLFTMSTTTLDPAPMSAPSSKVRGKVQLSGQTDHSGIVVSVSDSAETVTTNAEGLFEFAALNPGLHTFGFQKAGYRSVTQYNVLVLGAELELTLVTLVEGTSTPPDLDAGAPFDGGFGPLPDGGARPIAVANPQQVFFTESETVRVDGSGSLGQRPFKYRWEEVGTTRLTGLPVEGFNQATLAVPAPQGFTGPITLRLTVTDAFGTESLPLDFPVVIAIDRPYVAIEPLAETTVFAGWRVQVDTVTSDPNNVGIARHEWSVTPADGGIGVQPLDGGSAVLVMPQAVAAARSYTVSVRVFDNLGIPSFSAETNLLLSSAAGPSWSLQPSPFQVAGPNEVVTVFATPSVGVDAGQLTWQWSFAGTDAGLTLVDADTRTPQFVAPVISGASQTVSLRVTATDPSGALTPASQTAFAFVELQDWTPPVVARSSVTTDPVLGPRGNPFGAWIEFNEPLIQNSNLAYFEAREQFNNAAWFPQLQGTWRIEGQRARVVFRGFAEEGAALELSGSDFQDVSPRANRSVATVIPYLVSWAWPSPAVAIDSTTESNPGVVLTPLPQGGAAAHLVSRRDQRVAFHQPMVLPCDGGCVVTEDLSAPTVALASTGSRRGPRALVAGGIPYVAAQTVDAVNAGVVVGRLPDAGWTSVGPLPGPMFAGLSSLQSSTVQGGDLRVHTFNPATRSWQSIVAYTAATEFLPLDGGVLRSAGWVTPNGHTWLLAESNAGSLYSYSSTLDAGFASMDYTDFGASPDDVRLSGWLGSSVPQVFSLLLRGGVVEITNVESFVLNTVPPTASGSITEFDVAPDESMLWVATVEAGQLVVWSVHDNVIRPIPGPPRAMMSSTSLNVDTTCVAASPSIARLEDHVVVAWSERCGAGAFKTYLRSLR